MGSRIIHTAQSGDYSSKVRFNSEWQVYIVQFFVGETYMFKADYETTDRVDALDTAHSWVNKFMGGKH